MKLRDEKARLLGFKSHAEFQLATKMAKSPSKVLDFLSDLRTRLAPGGKEEIQGLRDLKKADLKEIGLQDDGKYYLWDHRYVCMQTLRLQLTRTGTTIVSCWNRSIN
jgi:metallopeptidase MepB